MNTKLSEKDNSFLRLLFGTGEIEQRLETYGVFRGGDLLLALPIKRKFALKSLDLYQPQSLKAKLFTVVVKSAVMLGFRWFQKKITLEIRETSPLLAVSRNSGFGFLLGNPESVARRMICYYHNKGKDFVSKIGVGGLAKTTVEAESINLMEAASELKCAPMVISYDITDDFSQYTVEWIKGKSPQVRQEPLLTKLLEGWQEQLGSTSLKNNSLFLDALDSTNDQRLKEYFDKIDEFPLCKSIVHGDFTSWNIKVDKQDQINVLDWEYCTREGVAGWDIAHYYTQSKYLVKRMNPDEVIDCLLYWAKNEQGHDYLKQAGWGNNHLAWVGSYLVIAQYHFKYELEELVKYWKIKANIDA